MPTTTTNSIRMTSSPITVVAASCARLGFPLPSSCPTRVLAAPVHHTLMSLVPGHVAALLCATFRSQAGITDPTAAHCLLKNPCLHNNPVRTKQHHTC